MIIIHKQGEVNSCQTVSSRTLQISYGYLGLIKKEIPLADIIDARVVDYRPIRHSVDGVSGSGSSKGKNRMLLHEGKQEGSDLPGS